MAPPVDKLLGDAGKDPDLLAVILFGSAASGTATPSSDIDVCLVLAGNRHGPLERSISRASNMLDRERILGKLAELDGYLEELRGIAPGRFEDYQLPEKKRACERDRVSRGNLTHERLRRIPPRGPRSVEAGDALRFHVSQPAGPPQ